MNNFYDIIYSEYSNYSKKYYISLEGNHMKKKFLTLCIALAMLLPSTACASSNTPGATTDTSGEGASGNVQQTTESAEETTADIKPNLPEIKRNGEEFRFFAEGYITNGAKKFYNVHEETGEVVNDAAYKRNRTVEEQFGIKMSYIEGIANGKTDVFEASVAAGSKEFNLMTSIGTYVTKVLSRGYIQALDSFEYLDLSKTYYFPFVTEEMAVLGKHYTASGYFDMVSLSRTMSVLFSTKLAEDNNVGDIYSLVEEGKWTFDAMFTMAQKASRDLNGDGQMTEVDQYGVCAGHNKNSQLVITAGYNHTRVNDKGYREPTGYNDTLLSFNEMLVNAKGQSWYFDCYPYDGVTKGKNQFDTLGVDGFAENRYLFFLYDISATDALAGRMDDYGILPIPKFTENQKNYISSCSPGMTAIPMDASDPAFSAAVLEVLNYESYKTLLPAYYDITLSKRYASSEKASAMLDIIFENTSTDFVFMWNSTLKFKPYTLNISVGLTKDYVSYFESIREQFAKLLIDTFDGIAAAQSANKK